MCLSVAVSRPNDVLSRGEHAGFEWMVVHSGMGYRCGYVRMPPGHPWHGKDYNDIEAAEAHGGLTFSREDVACDKGGADDGWWVGFDCAHAGDAQDFSLPGNHHEMARVLTMAAIPPMLQFGEFGDVVRTTEYVESECRSLCEQAATAAKTD